MCNRVASYCLTAVASVAAISCGFRRSVDYSYAQRSELIEFQDSVSDSTLSFYPKYFLESASASSQLFANWSDPLFLQQWFLENRGKASIAEQVLYKLPIAGADIRMPQRWENIPILQPVVLAVLDTGVDLAHPDIDPDKFFVNFGESGPDAFGADKCCNGIDDDRNGYVDDVRGWNFADNSAQQKDANGHGTHLMGMLGAMHDNGVGISSPWRGFKILPVQIFSGSHPSIPSEKIAAAIKYAVDMGASVISASFGTPSFNQVSLDAVKYAEEHNVLFISAVGNFRKNLNVEPNYPSGFGLANQIAVGASDSRDLAASFSSFGNSVDIFAPGENLVSLALNRRYALRSGTSQACPLVAATAAMIRAIHPHLSAPQVKERILNAADERQGLVGFAAEPKRISVVNALAGVDGYRLPRFEFSHWNTISVNVQSEHPYRHGQEVRFRIDAPAGTKNFRLHFSAIQTESRDILTLVSQDGWPVATYSGSMGALWSPVLSGASVAIILSTDAFVSEWGFAVDRIESEPVDATKL